MTDISITTNAVLTADLLRRAPDILDARIQKTTVRFGALLQTRVRARASGRPGPRRQTGDYRRSISRESGRGPDGGHQATVGTNAPQGRRLEHGFVGADALGRTYNQPPYPHFGPALDETGPEYVAALEADIAAVDRMTGGRR